MSSLPDGKDSSSSDGKMHAAVAIAKKAAAKKRKGKNTTPTNKKKKTVNGKTPAIDDEDFVASSLQDNNDKDTFSLESVGAAKRLMQRSARARMLLL